MEKRVVSSSIVVIIVDFELVNNNNNFLLTHPDQGVGMTRLTLQHHYVSYPVASWRSRIISLVVLMCQSIDKQPKGK